MIKQMMESLCKFGGRGDGFGGIVSLIVSVVLLAGPVVYWVEGQISGAWCATIIVTHAVYCVVAYPILAYARDEEEHYRCNLDLMPIMCPLAYLASLPVTLVLMVLKHPYGAYCNLVYKTIQHAPPSKDEQIEKLQRDMAQFIAEVEARQVNK